MSQSKMTFIGLNKRQMRVEYIKVLIVKWQTNLGHMAQKLGRNRETSFV